MTAPECLFGYAAAATGLLAVDGPVYVEELVSDVPARGLGLVLVTSRQGQAIDALVVAADGHDVNAAIGGPSASRRAVR